MKKITTGNVEALLRGASLLGCGGGLSFAEQCKLIEKPLLVQALRHGISVVSPVDLADDACCATVSEIGASDAPVMDKTLLPQAKLLLEQKIGQKVTALIPGEIGQESIVLEAAAILDLPIVDGDLSGCRAVPRLTDLALVVRGIPFTMSPLVVLRDDGTAEFIPQQATLADDETKVRAMVKPHTVVTLFGGIVSGKMVKNFLAYDSYSRAESLGKALLKSKSLLSVLPTSCLLKPTMVTVTKLIQHSVDGFDQKTAILETASGETFELEIENEYMSLQSGSKTFSFPQLIMIFSPQKQRGLHSSEIAEGAQVTILVADMFDFWKETETRKNV